MNQKRSLAQVFLRDHRYISKILAYLEVQGQIILEIGPGKGSITEGLAKKAKLLYCVEIDKRLCHFLEEKFLNNSKVKIIHSNILEFPFSRIKKRLTVFSNAPYQISTPLIKYLVNQREYVKAAYLTFQKEFAEKLLAKPSTAQYGALSCYLQYYARIEKLLKIPRGAFNPVPKVDSVFLKVDFYDRLPIRACDEDFLFKIIEKAFSAPRKKIINSLGLNRSEQKIIASLMINRDLRPQDLSLNDYITIANKLYR